jgi:hypothetical protein
LITQCTPGGSRCGVTEPDQTLAADLGTDLYQATHISIPTAPRAAVIDFEVDSALSLPLFASSKAKDGTCSDQAGTCTLAIFSVAFPRLAVPGRLGERKALLSRLLLLWWELVEERVELMLKVAKPPSTRANCAASRPDTRTETPTILRSPHSTATVYQPTRRVPGRLGERKALLSRLLLLWWELVEERVELMLKAIRLE